MLATATQPSPLSELRSDLADAATLLRTVAEMIEFRVSPDLMYLARYKMEELARRLEKRQLEKFGDLPRPASQSAELMGPLD